MASNRVDVECVVPHTTGLYAFKHAGLDRNAFLTRASVPSLLEEQSAALQRDDEFRLL